jgi:cyclic dehypoxanthinyl futalosine synthase
MGITRKEALDCFQSDDLIGIGMEADAVRRQLHPEGVVTYVLDGQLDYPSQTNEAAYAETLQFIDRIAAQGATSVTLQGKPTSNHTIHWLKSLFRTIKEHFPTLHLHSLSATEIRAIANHSGSTTYETLAQFREAGLDSLPGNDAGLHIDLENWLTIHRTAHQLGMQTTASLHFEASENPEDRVSYLAALRDLQEETGGFTSFKPQTILSTIQEEPTAVEYLKTLAISRLYLDNIPHIQSSLETQGPKVLQVGLRFGSNDAGSILLADGPNAASEEQVRQIIRDAGFKPVQRDSLYRTMFLN